MQQNALGRKLPAPRMEEEVMESIKRIREIEQEQYAKQQNKANEQ